MSQELKEHLFVPHSELQEGDELTDAFTIAKSYYLKPEVDAVLAEKDAEIRRLKRARWMDRAARANAEWGHWATIWFCDTGAVLNINKSSVSQDPYRCTIMRNAAEWRNLWAEVGRTCRAMAERFKD